MKPHEIAEMTPEGIKLLPFDPERGFPVPWFVTWIDGKPDFRIVDPHKIIMGVQSRLCFICGRPLTAQKTFVGGPITVINRISSEPPNHFDCAEYAARVCPFLSRPQARRRDKDMPEEVDGVTFKMDPLMVRRNAGITALWTTLGYRLIKMPRERVAVGFLLHMGDPVDVRWMREGRPATRAEVVEGFEEAMPSLMEIAVRNDEVPKLHAARAAAEKHLPSG